MSSIAGLGQSLLQRYQSFAAQQSSATQAIANTSSVPTATGLPAVPTGGHHHGHGSHGAQNVSLSKIASAVTNALKSAPAGAKSNPNQLIQNAITQLLSGTSGTSSTQTATPLNGIASTNAASISTIDPEETNATNETDTDENFSPASFLQTLQNFGVSPEQFREDFMTAMKTANASQTGTSNPFKKFPPGSLLDTTA
jgi:hypothetical protein